MMLRTFGKLAFALTLAAAFAAPAHAQRGGQGQGRGMGMMGGAGLGVLTNPAGEKELSLSDEQKEKISGIMEDMRADMRDKFQGLGQDLSQQERMEKAQEIMRELTSSSEAKLKDVLKADQYKRYQEIKLQAMGLDAFMQPDVAKKLELTDEQTKKLETLQTTTREKTMEMMQSARDSGDMQGAFAKMQEVREKALGDAKSMLTDSQKETWTEMTGKPFKMEPFGGGPGRRPTQ